MSLQCDETNASSIRKTFEILAISDTSLSAYNIGLRASFGFDAEMVNILLITRSDEFIKLVKLGIIVIELILMSLSKYWKGIFWR